MKDFYVQLMSNASTSEFTDNKANSFKNRLPYPLLFESDKEWKVGLASVSYPIPPSRPHQVPVPQAHDFDDDYYVFGMEWTIETFRLQDDGITWRPSRYPVTFEGTEPCPTQSDEWQISHAIPHQSFSRTPVSLHGSCG